jgi:ribosome maturation factor RimP
MDIEKNKLEHSLRELVENNGYLLIDLAILNRKGGKVIEVYVDNETGITVDDCAKLSRILNDNLENLGLKDLVLRLDVSSPGIDRDLKYLPQYKKHVNRWFKVNYVEGEAVKEKEMKLKSIDNEELTFEKDEKEIKINYNDIKKAKVIIKI